MDEREREQLVQRVTDLVLMRLAGGGPSPVPAARRSVLLLLPVVPRRLGELAAEAARVRAAGHELRTLVAPEVRVAIEGARLGDRFSPGLLDTSPPDLLEALGGPRPAELVVLGALSFAAARRLIELQDDDPFVRVVSGALLAGQTVLAAVDELTPRVPGAAGELVRRAEALRRGLEQLGVALVSGAEWEDRVGRAAAAATTCARAIGGLLTEDDVRLLWAAGERRLVLPARTIVTPLARSRAAALGLELVEKGS